MDRAKFPTQSELGAYCEEHAADIYVRIGAKNVALSELPEDVVRQLIVKWWQEGRYPVRVLPSKEDK